MEPIILQTASADATQEAAALIAALLQPGDVVALSGELGAGKTCFVQGAARTLGIADRVTSPTFTLVRIYPNATIPLVHTDVYRLNRLHDVYDLGDEVFADDVVTMVEWGDAIGPMLPVDRLEVELSRAGGPDDDGNRRIVLRPKGRWNDRHAKLQAQCADWMV